MVIPFTVGETIEGLETSHSWLEGSNRIWHKVKVLAIEGEKIQITTADEKDPPFNGSYWVTYRKDWFRKLA